MSSTASLPPGWTSHVDPATQLPFYYNTTTGHTQWEAPVSVPVSAVVPAAEAPEEGGSLIDLDHPLMHKALHLHAEDEAPSTSDVQGDNHRQHPPHRPATLKHKVGKQQSPDAYDEDAAPKKDYTHMAREYTRMARYRPRAANTDADTNPSSVASNYSCVLCRREQCNQVFLPCMHMCVCQMCILTEGFCAVGASADQGGNWSMCPVCCEPIKIILEHTGDEEQRYWSWVLQVNPPLPPGFKARFNKSKHLIEHMKVSRMNKKSSVCTVS